MNQGFRPCSVSNPRLKPIESTSYDEAVISTDNFKTIENLRACKGFCNHYKFLIGTSFNKFWQVLTNWEVEQGWVRQHKPYKVSSRVYFAMCQTKKCCIRITFMQHFRNQWVNFVRYTKENKTFISWMDFPDFQFDRLFWRLQNFLRNVIQPDAFINEK